MPPRTEAAERALGLAFFERALATFETACQRAGEYSFDYALGPERMRWRFSGDAMRSQLEPALRHLQLPPGARPS